MSRNKITSIVFSAALWVFVLICAGDAFAYLPPKFGGTLKVAIPTRVSSINPSMAMDDHEFMIAGCIFETLVAQGKGGDIVAVLLDELPVESDDHLTYYFKLRDGIKFHDGTPLDSADVIHSFKKLILNRRSPYSWIFQDVEGVDEFISGEERFISGMRITDPRRFEIKLARENSDFIKYLTFKAASIIPTADREYEPPIGTGPFVYSSKSVHGDVILSANEEYRLGRPYLDSIEFILIRDEQDRVTELIRGEVDVIETPLGGIGEEESNLFPEPAVSVMKRLYFLDLDATLAIFSDPGTRRNVSNLIDRAGIVRNILTGQATAENNMEESATKVGGIPHAAKKLELIHMNHIPALSNVSRKISYDLQRGGIETVVSDTNPQGLLQYSAQDAPDMMLRSMPVLFSLPKSYEVPLFDPEYMTRVSSVTLRAHPSDGTSETPPGAMIAVFSYRPSYMFQEYVHGMDAGPHGDALFENAFIRKEISEMDSLEN